MVLYLVRILTIGIAVGVLFIRCGLFRQLNAEQTLLLGIGASPLFASLANFLLGLVFLGWPSWFYVSVPFLFACVWLAARRNYALVLNSVRRAYQYCANYCKSLGRWVLLDVLLASGLVSIVVLLYGFKESVKYHLSVMFIDHRLLTLGIAIISVIVFAAIAVYFIRRMLADGTFSRNLYLIFCLTVFFHCCFVGISVNARPIVDSDRSHYELNARYFVEDKNSWEIDNYSDEKYGSSFTDDHGPLWVTNLADGWLAADACGLGDGLRIANCAVFWTYCCFLLLLFLVGSCLAGTYKAGILSILLFKIYVYDIMMAFGSRDAFRFVGLLLLFLYAWNQFEEIAGNRTRWFHHCFMFLFCYLSMNGHEGNVYIMLGMFVVMGFLMLVKRTPFRQLLMCGIAVLAGTILGISKTISLYLTTGSITSSTTLVFHDTPVIDQIRDVNASRADWGTIWASYSIPVLIMMVFGVLALVVLLIQSWKKKDTKTAIAGLLILGLLLPMTGVMDWLGYECSRWFFEQYRYRMYFLMLLAVTGAWLLTRGHDKKCLSVVFTVSTIMVFSLSYWSWLYTTGKYHRQYMDACISLRDKYETIADIAANITDGDLFLENQILLYYLHGTPKLLYHPYSETLIQAKTDDEIAAAMETLNIGAIILPEDGLEYHNYSLLPFWDYINDESHFIKLKLQDTLPNEKWVIFYPAQ